MVVMIVMIVMVVMVVIIVMGLMGVMKFNEIIKEIENLCIASIQNEYSLMCRLFDNDFNELSINENIPLLAYSPLARGLLTGKYIGNKIPEGSRLSRDDKIRKIIK